MANAEYIMELTGRIETLCEIFQEYRGDVESREEGEKVKGELQRLCREVRGMVDISHPSLLRALMDMYEITRDENMLQEVLDTVSRGIGQLKVSPESVELLAYCYYYVEDEECALLAKRMLSDLLKIRNRPVDPVFTKTLEVYNELVGNVE